MLCNVIMFDTLFYMLVWAQRLTALDGKRRFALAAASSHKEEVGKLRSEYTSVACLKCIVKSL